MLRLQIEYMYYDCVHACACGGSKGEESERRMNRMKGRKRKR